MDSPIKLPELPSSADPVEVIVEGRPAYREAWRRYYTEHQMRAYAEQAVREALEDAASIADRQHFGGQRDDDLSWTDCAALIAVKIRALIPEKDHGEPS